MIYAIADLHLPSTLGKTMDRFGPHWVGHSRKIRENWQQRVRPEDSVLVCGDISWATRLKEAQPDLDFLAALPGTKYLIRGNHDYWWRRGATHQIQKLLPPGLVLLLGEGRVIEGMAVGGARGWQAEGGGPTPKDAAIIERELSYLRRSFEDLPPSPRVAMLHYPPYNPDLEWNEFGRLLLDLGVELALFGHLHLGNPQTMEGVRDGIELQLVAADQVDFIPQPLRIQ